MKTIGVIGTRCRDETEDFEVVFEEFRQLYEPGDSICSGLCPKGGDRFAVIISESDKLLQDKIIWHPANWEKHGKAAGFIRNGDIARDSDVLIACITDDRTGGTEDTIKKWEKIHRDNDELELDDLYLV